MNTERFSQLLSDDKIQCLRSRKDNIVRYIKKHFIANADYIIEKKGRG